MKIVGVIRVKNHDFTPKNHIFSNFRGAPPPPGSAPDDYQKNHRNSVRVSALRKKSKDWLTQNQYNVSELGDMSGLLFQ